MNNLGIIGFGGHSKVVEYIAGLNNYNSFYYFDINYQNLKIYNDNQKIIGDIKDISSDLNIDAYFVGIGNNINRKKNIEILLEKNLDVINLIHPSAQISHDVSLSNGIIIMANVVINPNVKIGNGAIINTSSILEHDTVVGDYCHLAPNTCLCGNVKINDLSTVGASSVIIPGINIGKNVTIGAGSTVINNIADNSTAYGNPARAK